LSNPHYSNYSVSKSTLILIETHAIYCRIRTRLGYCYTFIIKERSKKIALTAPRRDSSDCIPELPSVTALLTNRRAQRTNSHEDANGHKGANSHTARGSLVSSEELQELMGAMDVTETGKNLECWAVFVMPRTCGYVTFTRV
jgi:hypothetical protein